jgi:hypothetical protein
MWKLKWKEKSMPSSIQLFTIGFTQKSAEQFFETLINSGVKTLIDTRLNNVWRCRQKYELDGRKDRRVVKIMNQQPHRVTQHI